MQPDAPRKPYQLKIQTETLISDFTRGCARLVGVRQFEQEMGASKLKANQISANQARDDGQLYAVAGPSSLAACIHQVLRNLISDDEAYLAQSSEVVDVLVTEVCTACRSNAFMDCEGNCSQACDLTHQVLFDAKVQANIHFARA